MRQISKSFSSVIVALATSWLAAAGLAADRAASPSTVNTSVLVLPFSALNQSEEQRWLGRSIQQSLVADLTVVAPKRVLATEAQAGDDAAAIELGRKAGARYVVRGDFASVGRDTRITGQVFDVDTGKPVTAIKATGPSSNVFWLEDDLATQIRRRLALAPISSASPATQSAPAPMEPLRMPPAAKIDPYAQTYVAPVEGSRVPADVEYDYYFSQPGDICFSGTFCGSIWPGSGYGIGCTSFGNSGQFHCSGGHSARAGGLGFHAGHGSGFHAAMAATGG